MSIAQLLFKEGNFIEEIEIDVVITEGATATARITKNPVEQGADINDHIIIDPMVFRMSGVVSNASSNIFQTFTTLPNIVSVLSDDVQSRAQIAWDKLLTLHAKRTKFTLKQGLRSYDNIVLETLEEDQDKDTDNALFFNATFTELNIVGVSTIAEVLSDPDISDSMVPATEGGLKQVGPAPS